MEICMKNNAVFYFLEREGPNFLCYARVSPSPGPSGQEWGPLAGSKSP